jgi:hypothetical protein
MEDLGSDRRIILKLILKTEDGGNGRAQVKKKVINILA